MMAVHPLFAGFAGVPLDRLGRCLGFDLLAEARPGDLPPDLSMVDRRRLGASGDLAGYGFAGGWQTPGQHCLLFAKPLNESAWRLWLAGLPAAVSALALALAE